MERVERRREDRWPEHHAVRLLAWDKWGEALAEDTVTEDVSPHGLAVLCNLPLERGRYLQVIRLAHTRSFIARVCARTFGAGQRKLLHLELVNQRWPLDLGRGGAQDKGRRDDSHEPTFSTEGALRPDSNHRQTDRGRK